MFPKNIGDVENLNTHTLISRVYERLIDGILFHLNFPDTSIVYDLMGFTFSVSDFCGRSSVYESRDRLGPFQTHFPTPEAPLSNLRPRLFPQFSHLPAKLSRRKRRQTPGGPAVFVAL